MELQQLSSLDIKCFCEMWGFTLIESKNQIVACGRRIPSNPSSIYVLENNSEEQMVEARMNLPCQHYFCHKRVLPVMREGKELLALACTDCSDIKLVDMVTRKVKPVFTFPRDSVYRMCSGPDGSMFVSLGGRKILHLDISFKITNTFECGIFPCILMCFLPAPDGALVVSNNVEIRAVSIHDGNPMWSQDIKGFIASDLIFSSYHNVLLISSRDTPHIHIVNPTDGTTLQTVAVPGIRGVRRMCFHNDQIVVLHFADEYTGQMVVFYYNLK